MKKNRLFNLIILLTNCKNTDRINKQRNKESYSRGSRGHPAKVLGRATGARVQIPHSPPTKDTIYSVFFYFWVWYSIFYFKGLPNIFAFKLQLKI